MEEEEAWLWRRWFAVGPTASDPGSGCGGSPRRPDRDGLTSASAAGPSDLGPMVEIGPTSGPRVQGFQASSRVQAPFVAWVGKVY
jgi:hypothetical protein